MSVVALARLGVAAGRWWLAADDPLGPVDQDPDQVRDDACHIVSADPSVCATTDTTPASTSRSGGAGLHLDVLALLFWMLLIAAVVLLVIVAVRAAMRRGWVPARRRHRARDAGDADEVERGAVVIDHSREPTDWRAEAERHRRDGRYRDALRCRYRALVGDLARRGVIDEIPGRTTGEERAQLRVVRPQAAPPFDAAADLFDGAWYGHRDVAAADDDRFQSLAAEVLGGAGEWS